LKEAKAAAGGTIDGLVTPRLTNEELYLFGKLLKDTLGSANVDHSAGYAHAALTGGALESLGCTASPSTIADIQKTDLLLVVKTDSYETHPVLGFEINLGVKRKGVDLRIVSDKRGKLSKLPKATTYVHKPGSELALVNTIAKLILDENLLAATATNIPGLDDLRKSLEAYAPEKAAELCSIGADELKALARDYAKAEKALILLPIGLGYPGHDKELAQALINLALLTGRIGKEGSGILILGEKNNSQGAVDMGIYPAAQGKSAMAILDACAAGVIKTLYVAGENPVISYPNRKKVESALDKLEFLIVQDMFLTETAERADVVLPACSFAEKNGSFTSVGRAVQRVNKAIKPIGLSRSDFDIFNSLNANIGDGSTYADVAAVFAEIAGKIPAYAGLTLDGLGDDGVILPVQVNGKFVAVAAPALQPEAGN